MRSLDTTELEKAVQEVENLVRTTKSVLDERLRCLWAVGEIDKDRMLAAAAGIRNHVLCGMPRKVTQRRIVPNVAHR